MSSLRGHVLRSELVPPIFVCRRGKSAYGRCCGTARPVRVPVVSAGSFDATESDSSFTESQRVCAERISPDTLLGTHSILVTATTPLPIARGTFPVFVAGIISMRARSNQKCLENSGGTSGTRCTHSSNRAAAILWENCEILNERVAPGGRLKAQGSERNRALRTLASIP
jgi:hypothetical protein